MPTKKKPYIKIIDFKRFQHYKTGGRSTIWIKLYIQEMLFSERFFSLTEFERWVFIGLLLLAGWKKNKIPYEKNFLKGKILHYKTPIEKLDNAIISLKNANLIAIKMLSRCYQNACLEKEIEKEIEREREIEKERGGEPPTREDEKKLNKQIAHVFNLFKQINPLINFGHKTNRKAVEELLTLGGLEKTEKLVKYAISVQGQKYAPTITTPYQLKEKLAQLKIYYNKNKKSNDILW